MKNLGLVLEGGGMRGLYTAGVLDFFMDKNLYFPYVASVSAGACNAVSYLSRQKGRSREINIRFANDPRYINLANLLKRKSIFGMDFIFNEVANKILPFDFKQFEKSNEKLIVCATDCHTGKAIYFDKDACDDIFLSVRASSSLPFVCEPVKFQGKTLLDGGIAEPIPIKKSILDGNTKNIIVLTRDSKYRKKPFRWGRFSRLYYPKYPQLTVAFKNRYMIYNNTLDYIDDLERNGDAFVIRPDKLVEINRIERDVSKLADLYDQGYADAHKAYDDMLRWIG